LVIAHYGGIDELAVIWMPAVMGIGLWLIFRTGKKEEASEEDVDARDEQR
jgi:cbb3-type cytochrome oxidase subunit 3